MSQVLEKISESNSQIPSEFNYLKSKFQVVASVSDDA